MEKMLIEADSSYIYCKLLDVMFEISEDGYEVFSKVIQRIGGFHVAMCILKTIFSGFKDSGIITLFVYSGISGEGTVKHALKSGDVKFGIHLHKWIFEATIRTNIV